MPIQNRDGALFLATGIDNSGLNSGLSDAERRINSFEQSATNAGKSISNALDLKLAIEAQKQAIASLEEQYKRSKTAFDSLGNNFTPNHRFSDKEIEVLRKQYDEAKKNIEDARRALDREKKALQELELQEKQLSNTRQQSATSYMTQMRKIRQEMQELAMAGKQESPRYRELESELTRVGTAYRRVMSEQRLLTTAGNAQLAGMIQGVTGLSGAFSAAQGVSSLFIKNNEQLTAIQTKLQAAISITMGLQAIANTMHATSSFRITTVTKATALWTTANYALGKSFIKMGTSAATARIASAGLLSFGIGALIVGVGLLIKKYQDWSKEQERKTKLLKEEQAVLREANKNTNEQLIKVKALEAVLRNSNETYSKRNIALNELKTIMPTYNALLSKEGKLIEDNTGALKKYVRELKNSALAKIYVDKYAKAQEDYETWLDNLSPVDKKIRDLSDEDLKKTGVDLSAEWKRIRKEEIEHQKALQKWDQKSQEYIAKDIDKVEANTKEYWEIQQKSALARLNTMKEEKKGSKEWTQALAEYNQASTKLKQWDFSDTAKNKAESAAEKTRKKLEELSKAKGKQSLQDIRTAKDLEFKMTEARIRAMDEGSAKVIAQMEFDYEKEKEALKRQQEDALKTKKDNARDIFEADVKNKGKSFDDSSIKLTDDERKKYADLQVKSDEAYQKDKLTLELQYMRDYIKEYGTFQEKKLTIAQEYDKKIAASANEWDRKILENQKKAALSSVDFDAINKRIDWQGVFGNLTGMLDSQLKDLISGLKEYIKTDQFKQSSATDQKTVFDAIEKLRSVTPGGEGTLNFKDIQRQMDDLGNAINHLQIATLNEKTAYDNLGKAQNEYDKALKSNNQATIEGAKRALAMAQTAANTSSIAYKEAESNVQNLGNGFKETATDTIDGLNLVSDGLNNFASNSLPQIFKGLQSTVTGLSKLNIGGKVGEVIGTLSKTLSNASVVGQIIDAVLSILDVLKDGIGTLVSSLIDTVLGAIDGILKNILSFDITKQIAGSLKTGLSNILNTLSFGGFNSLISSINGGNAKETAKTISRLTSSNEALKVSVDALKDEIAGTNGSKSIQAYNEAVTAQERYSENLRKILDAQMRYSNSHHSNAYYWDLDANSLKEVNKLLGTSLNNTWNDFSKLTADQMNEIRTHLPDVWSEMINEGKYGDRFKDDWNNYADQAGKVKEMTEDLRENIAQISFDSLRDSFLNTLMDMDSDAEDFADNFEEYLTKALLNFAVGDLLDSRIKKWYESWTDTINEQNGKLTEAQIAQQKKEWEDIVKEGIAIRDNITNSTGYTGKNDINGITGVAASITQDSANELNGNFYAVRQSLNDVRNINKQTQEYIKVQTGHISDVKEAVSSYKQVFADQLEYQKQIAENTAATASILRDIRDKGIDLRR